MDSDLDWISHQELTRITGAHPSTVKRWKTQARATGRLPPWLALIVAAYRGMLDALHPAWAGWIINRRDGALVSPEGACMTMGQVRAVPVLRELLREREGEIGRLREALVAAEISAQRAHQQITQAHQSQRDQPGAHWIEGSWVPELRQYVALRITHHHAAAQP